MATKAATKQPAERPPNYAAFVFGGLFLSVWVYGLLFKFPEWHDFNWVIWFFWGLLGFLIAGGLYAALVTSEIARIVIMVLVGLSIGILILAAALEQEGHIIASFVTATGAGLIASALPRPHADKS